MKTEDGRQETEDERQQDSLDSNHALDFDSPNPEARIPSPESRIPPLDVARGGPELVEGPDPDPERLSLWTALSRGLEAKRFTARAAASLGAFRDLLLSLTEMSRRAASAAIAKVSTCRLS
jgi:hypothetical protein